MYTFENISLKLNKEFKNPLILQRADPWVYKHTDGYYYFTGSVPSYDCIELRRSASIQGLGNASPKVIWNKHETGVMGAHIWAPEIHFINNKWYIYFAAGNAEAIWDIRIYALENSASNPLEGYWEEKGQVKTNWESFALDATTFEHKGERYLVWAQNDPKGPQGTNIYIAAMENPWTIKGKQVMISHPEYEWERIGHFVNEGPAVLKRNGRIFISYSASATDHNYCMGLLSASDTSDLLETNSWNKSSKAVFQTNVENSQYGPGHNSFTVSEDGSCDILIYHARNYKELQGSPLTDPNRHTRAQRLNWDEDGAPSFGIPVAD